MQELNKESLIKILDCNYLEIKEIALFSTYDEFKSLKKQGFNVSWMGEYKKDEDKDGYKDKELFTILIEE